MATWEINASGVSAYKIIMEATVSGSTVTVSAKWRRDAYGYSSNSAGASYRIVIDGTTYSGTWNFSGPAGGAIATRTINTRSKNTGYKGNVNVQVYVNFDVSPGSGTISRTINVSTLPSKPAAPTLSSTVAGRVTMTWPAPSSNGGSAITGYRIWYWVNGTWAAVDNGTTRSRTFVVPEGATFTAQVAATNANGNGTMSDQRSITVMVSPPSAPSALAVARVSDTQHTLTWTRNSTYTSVIVQRLTDSGAWQQVGVASGNAATYTDTTTAANRRYQYRVAGVNAGGQSGWSNTQTVFTTPAAPTGVAASRTGNDIVVSATATPPWATSYEIRDGSTTVGSGQLPFTHAAPNPAVAHTYTVRALVTGLASAWSAASNTVQILAAPNAPTNLAPNGGVVATGDETARVTWKHNPVDSSLQTMFEYRFRDAGTTEWFTRSNVSWPESGDGLVYAMEQAGYTSTPGVMVEWQVRTKGAHPDWSPWSNTATFTVLDRPGVAVTQPDTEWKASTLVAEWSWFQTQNRPQSAWQLELWDEDGTIVETRSGTGDTSTLTLNRRLTEGDWSLHVRAATGAVWSEWAAASFTVVFDPPAEPDLFCSWDEALGGVTVQVGFGSEPVPDPDPEEPVELTEPVALDGDVAATVSFTLERSVVDGVWEQVLGDTPADDTLLVDWEALSYGTTTYRCTAYTVEGATAEAVFTVDADSPALWLSGGVGFGVTARLPLDPDITITAGRARTLKQYAGRSLPVSVTGEALAREVAFAGETSDLEPDTAPTDRLEEIAQVPENVFLFRDPDGHRIFGAIEEIQMQRTSSVWDDDAAAWNSVWSYSVKLTETDRAS